MHGVTFAPEANDQLLELYRYVAERGSPAVATSFTDAIVDYCERLAHFPRRGTKRDDIRMGLRTVGFRRWVTIAFTVDETTITILGVFYGGRDYETSLREDFSLPPDTDYLDRLRATFFSLRGALLPRPNCLASSDLRAA